MTEQQLQLFNPSNPPLAFSRAEIDARLEAPKAKARERQLALIRAHNEARTANLFHDRRDR